MNVEATRPETAYPDFVRSTEAKRRWRIVSYAALMLYDLQDERPLTGRDQMTAEHCRRAFFASQEATGPGDLSAAQLNCLVRLELL